MLTMLTLMGIYPELIATRHLLVPFGVILKQGTGIQLNDSQLNTQNPLIEYFNFQLVKYLPLFRGCHIPR